MSKIKKKSAANFHESARIFRQDNRIYKSRIFVELRQAIAKMVWWKPVNKAGSFRGIRFLAGGPLAALRIR